MELKTIAWIAGGLAIAGLSGLLGVWIWRRKKTTAEKAEEELLKRTASPRPEPPPQPKPPNTTSSSPGSASATTRTAGDQSPRTSASASASGLGSFVSAATIASTLVGSPTSDGHREARKHETSAAEPAPEPAESFVDEQTSPAANEAPVLIKFNDRRKVHKIRRGAVVDVQTPDDAGVGDFRVSRDDVHVALIEQDPSRVRLRLDGGEGMVRLCLIDHSDRPVCAWKFKLVA